MKHDPNVDAAVRATALLLLLLLAWPRLSAAQFPGNPLRQVLRHDTVGLARVLAHPEAYRLQILYTRIRRDAAGRPHFRSSSYRLRPREYFYPASAIKLAAAALALEKLRALAAQVSGLTAESVMLTDSAYPGQTRVRRDTSSATGRPSVANYVRKALLVSDNDAFNRLYEFVGPAELNAGLARLGLRHSRLLHRLSVGDQEPASRHTNPVAFYADTAATQLLYQQPAAFYAGPWPRAGLHGEQIGQAYMKGDQQLPGPLDFRQKNAFSLPDLQRLLRAVLFPESVPSAQRLLLAPEDYALLRQVMSQLPRESHHPRYDVAHYPDTYAKFLLGGGGIAPLPPGVRVFNKIGQAYGFLIDNAYIVDAEKGVEFLLSAVIYVNADGVLNDDKYEYNAIGFPFMRDLGLRIYEAESRAQRNLTPAGHGPSAAERRAGRL
ncbi:serine hydrolase [Hymenobacter sp. BT770]|uniref:serine hydrolase n=1 Tax=Hymenobacter sp. BT770 TaxID=2886942 RepID=UPI001D100CCA|nr:serine hydrolase [Hymenobacter sp. BT770]MCC3154236.1 class A beta-lactamase-related serine hydrolase [Hymenobacter sp. BT770]MDO3416384.1 serine hydrolase [Hymenobacter sp. BT770]